MDLFKLTFSTLLARKMWVVVLVAAVVTPIVFPLFTPHETNTTLLQPARAQTAWTMTWLIGILWTLSQAARFGESNSRTGVGAYFRSQGVGPLRQSIPISRKACSIARSPRRSYWETTPWAAARISDRRHPSAVRSRARANCTS